MSCSTINQQSIGLNVAVANLPEGFCPASMQELLQAFGARLIVTPNQAFNGFAIGSTEPSSNVGPWFKDCLEFFVFDDATSAYIPLQVKGVFNNEQFFNASGSFVVPAFTYRLKISAWGAGGGGKRTSGGADVGGGGGGGAFVRAILNVLPGQIVPITVGMGGTEGIPGTAGGATTVLTLSAGGGLGATGPNGALGGVAAGGTMNFNGGNGDFSIPGSPSFGGNSPQGGQGGTSGSTGATKAGVFPGGGGCGGYPSLDSGNGAGGACLVEW